ncbi:MAG: DUF1223 domain-containing protein [Paracoccaceae bacterium]|nr:DUF1223 domain-containing protein [Paracoccaceae bacterium]
MVRFGFIAAMMTVSIGSMAVSEEYGKNNPVVVELYTSQGCSSCPPADELLEKLTRKGDVIPLALHVNYWDYIGWKDQFAVEAHTKRQKSYSARAGARTIYTPQMVVGGVDHVVGFKPMDLAEAMEIRRKAQTPVTLNITANGTSIDVMATSDTRIRGGAEIVVVRYTPKQTVDILRGENAGRKLTYNNIVTSLERVAKWDGRRDFTMNFNPKGNEPVVVMVQEANHGPILAAALYSAN